MVALLLLTSQHYLYSLLGRVIIEVTTEYYTSFFLPRFLRPDVVEEHLNMFFFFFKVEGLHDSVSMFVAFPLGLSINLASCVHFTRLTRNWRIFD